jgi:hypothetical protein
MYNGGVRSKHLRVYFMLSHSTFFFGLIFCITNYSELSYHCTAYCTTVILAKCSTLFNFTTCLYDKT